MQRPLPRKVQQLGQMCKGDQGRDISDAFLRLRVPKRRLIREVILTFAKVHTTDKG